MASPGKGSVAALRARRNTIAKMVANVGSMSVEDIANSVGVSTMTIYRDVGTLEEMGAVVLRNGTVHTLASGLSEAGAAFRAEQNVSAKTSIAKAAAELVPSGATMLLDDSTTDLFLIDRLLPRAPFFIVTNSLLVADRVEGTDDITLQITGGEYQRWSNALIGSVAIRMIDEVYADFCFVSTSGLSAGGCYHPYLANADIKMAMLRSAETKVLLVDSMKFSRRGVHRFARLMDFDYIVTDSNIAPDDLADLRASNSNLIIAPIEQ